MAGKHSFLQRSYRMISAPGQLSRGGTGCKRMESHIKQTALCHKSQRLGVPASLPPHRQRLSSLPHTAHTATPQEPKGFGLKDFPPPTSMTTAQWKEQALLIYSFSPFISKKASYLTCSNLATATTQLTKEHIPEENIPDLVLNNIIYQKRKELPTTLSCYPKF